MKMQLNLQKIERHDLRYPMDCEKIKNELDWTPQYAFKEALDETVAWYRSRML